MEAKINKETWKNIGETNWNFSLTAQREGDLNRLLVPRDTDGFQCGQDSEVLDKKYLMFFDLAKCADPLVPINGCPTPQTCVAECPKNNFIHDKNTCNNDLTAYKKQLVCKRSVNLNLIRNCNDVEKLIETEQCAKWYLKSEPCKFHVTFEIFFLTNSTKRKISRQWFDDKLCT